MKIKLNILYQFIFYYKYKLANVSSLNPTNNNYDYVNYSFINK